MNATVTFWSRGKLQLPLVRHGRMVLDRLRDLLTSSGEDDRELYRCVNCGDEFERPYQECPDCGGPYVAPVEDAGRNA